MEIIKHKNEIELKKTADFDLKKTFECGQCFRWDMDENNVFTGVALGRVMKLRQSDDSIFITCSENDFNKIWKFYFDIERDYKQIRQQLCIDDFMKRATEYGKGIRILRQEKWEALCSFIVSQNNNIPRIKSIIYSLCKEFGDEIKFDNKNYYTFPSVEKVASLNIEMLSPLRCGYRAEYIIRSAKMIADGLVDLEKLAADSPENARTSLKKFHGVGDKVANCVLLFGLHMLDAFPVDVWMKRAVEKHYGSGFDPKIFNPYAGIAQQYIFNYIRNSAS